MDSVTPVSRWFSRILVFTMGMTVVCFVLVVWLGIHYAHPTESQRELTDNVTKAFWGCLGVLIGTIGGKLT